MTMQRDLVIEKDVRILVPLVAGKPRSQQRLRQIRDFGNMDALSIQISSASPFGGKQFVARGIVNHASHHSSLMFEPQRYTKYRKAMREIGGSIQRVHIPAIVAVVIYQTTLFAQDVMRWPTCSYPFQDQGF